jgi:glutamine amidotransferase
MQMLATLSEEKMNSGENVPCLDLVKARVGLMQTGGLRLPHMGWDQITATADHPLLKGIPDGSYFYFVHSYAMEVCEGTVATCDYGGKFTAVVQHGNFTGTQFHPEKSGAIGARLLTNFVEM